MGAADRSPKWGRSEQPVNGLFTSLRRFVFEKLVNCVQAGGQSGDRKVNPAQPGAIIRGRRGTQALLLQFCQNESIHVAGRPVLLPHFGQLLASRGLPNPRQPLFPRFNIKSNRLRRNRRLLLGPDRAVPDPAIEIRDDRIGQLRLFWRHCQVLVPMADRGIKKALFRFAGHKGRAGIATLPKAARCPRAGPRAVFCWWCCGTRSNAPQEPAGFYRFSKNSD